MSADHEPLNPWMGLALGPVLTLACAYGARVNWQQYAKFPRQPTEVLVSAAAQHISEWVTLSDAQFHCDSVFESEWSPVRAAKEHNTYIVITDPAETRTVLGLYPGRADCSAASAAPAQGVLIPFSGTQVAGLTKAGLRLPGASANAPALLLCTSCGPGNSLLGASLFGFGSLLGIAWFSHEVRKRVARPPNNRLERTAHGATGRRR